MISKKKILAIIPARGGSKGLPRKNILNLGNKPLIAWTILAAHNSKYIDRLILSSDDEEICNVAKLYDCEVPFIRPDKLAQDASTTADVVLHAINQQGKQYDIIILLQPTSPFRTSQQIDEAIEQYIENNVATLASVSCLEKSLEWIFSLSPKNVLIPISLNYREVNRRQDSQKAYSLNGAIYVFDKNIFFDTLCFINEATYAYVMDTITSIDIDTIDDFIKAQNLLNIDI